MKLDCNVAFMWWFPRRTERTAYQIKTFIVTLATQGSLTLIELVFTVQVSFKNFRWVIYQIGEHVVQTEKLLEQAKNGRLALIVISSRSKWRWVLLIEKS